MAETKSSAKTPSTGAAPQQTTGPTLGQRIVGFLRAPGSGAAQGTRKQPSSTTRFIIGSVIFVFVAELLTYLIQIANIQFKLNLNQPIFGPTAGWFTWFFAINVVLILGLWIVLNRLGYFPRDMWAPRSGTTTARGSGGSGGSSAKNKQNANQIPGIGKARTRAERRYSTTAAATKAASEKGRAKTAAKPAAVVEEPLSTDHDEAYDRVRAAQRSRKRRALR